MSDTWLQRTELFVGSERLAQIKSARVLVVGLGGVGSWAAEMLCRSGVGSMTLVDADTVDVTNLNRQMPALVSTIGRAKCDVVAERLREINPDGAFVPRNMFVDADNIPAWSERAISSLHTLGILETPDKIAGAGDIITRGDMAKLLNKTMQVIGR